MKDDEYETPPKLYEELCYKYDIYPKLDVSCNNDNCMCEFGIMVDKNHSAFIQPWYKDGYDVWCNPPHSMTKQFVIRAYGQWLQHNINIMMIIPANSMCTSYAKECIEGKAEYHPIFKRPQFLKDGKLSKFPSRNSYFVVIWRRK